ncbi:sensor histidine kinase [Aliikangiella coralliicola]|uniref:sensor histidine kinase n=1 Tax=Aliikangiella coralliicola TaxID=2592383 RepID=UPI00143DC9DA|nr:sensor histidine kinase [Aliikangiella coralliicola]
MSIFYVSLLSFNRSPENYIYGVVGTLVFLPLYFSGYWIISKKIIFNIAGILVLGTLLALITPGASVFFVYAGAFCCRLGTPKNGFLGLLVIIIWIAIVSLSFDLIPYFYIPAALFTLLIGGVNIYQFEMDKKRKELILSREEVKALAKTAERERIARDLHDLIGHTFSVITLKAELAGKLIDNEPVRAKTEIKELEGISRDALKQVREVVTGFRSSDLNTELAHAKYVLESNEINFDYTLQDVDMSDEINKELAIIIKELVTNVLKHSQASRVNASVIGDNESITLKLADDGKGIHCDQFEGFGLQGIQERVDKFQGKLVIESVNGACFTISIPQGSAV